MKTAAAQFVNRRLLAPVATMHIISFASGICNAIASSTDPVIHVSYSSAIVSSTGIAFAWTGRTMSFDSDVRNASS